MKRFMFFNKSNSMLVKSAMLPDEYTQEQAFTACFPPIGDIKMDGLHIMGPLDSKESEEIDLLRAGGFVPTFDGSDLDSMSTKDWVPGGGL